MYARRLSAVGMFFNLLTDRYRRYHLSHLLMVAVIVGYTAFGALVFVLLENENELAHIAERHRTSIVKKDIARNVLMSEMQYIFFRHVNISALHQPPFQKVLDRYDQQMAFKLEADKKDRIDMIGERSRWTFWGAAYYAITLYTTIGYGDIAARTIYGRLFTMVYAIGGIPLVITVLNVWGGGLFKLMQGLWSGVFMRFWRALKIRSPKKKRRRPVPVHDDYDEFDAEESEHAALAPRRPSADLVPRPELPLQLAFFVFFVWMGLCACVFMFVQKWDFFTALYFCVISLTTIGLGDITMSHTIAVITFILIMLGLSVISMSISIIQLHIEYVFYKIMKSIESDFKKSLTEERRKLSMATSINEDIATVIRKDTSTVLSLPVPTPQQQAEYRQRGESGVLESDLDAVRKYTSSMGFIDQVLVGMMSNHQRKLINERVAEKAKMRTKYTQTDEKKTSSSAQTDNLKQLGDLQPLRDSLIISQASTDSESEEDEYAPATTAQTASANPMASTAGQRTQRVQRKKGLGRKKLYIYNIGD